jgi:hypothetical protein
MIPLIQSFNVQNLVLPHRKLAVANNILYLKSGDRKLLPDARPTKEAADPISGKKGLRGRFGTCNDKLPASE